MLTTSRKTAVVPATHPAHVPGVGIVKGNPKRCLICQQEIRDGDRWLKYTSPSEPDLPAYSIIVHENCERKAR